MTEIQENERRCNTCFEVKPMEMFSPNRNSKGGRLARCKACRCKLELDARKAKAAESPKESPYAWNIPRDDRAATDKALDIELRHWPALAPANDLFWRIGA